MEFPCYCHAPIYSATSKNPCIKARIHGATLRAILPATSVTRRGYTVATFRASLRAILDQRLPSSHAMMFTSRNPKWRRLAKKSFRRSRVDALALMPQPHVLYELWTFYIAIFSPSQGFAPSFNGDYCLVFRRDVT